MIVLILEYQSLPHLSARAGQVSYLTQDLFPFTANQFPSAAQDEAEYQE